MTLHGPVSCPESDGHSHVVPMHFITASPGVFLSLGRLVQRVAVWLASGCPARLKAAHFRVAPRGGFASTDPAPARVDSGSWGHDGGVQQDRFWGKLTGVEKGRLPRAGATPEFARQAVAAGARAMKHLTDASKRCMAAAPAQSRQLDDDHVGTEHIVPGVLAADREVADALARNGITETMFRAQFCDEPGPSPAGEIPLTVRARMILGFAQSAAAGDGGAICPRHLMLGVIAESRDWRRSSPRYSTSRLRR